MCKWVWHCVLVVDQVHIRVKVDMARCVGG